MRPLFLPAYGLALLFLPLAVFARTAGPDMAILFAGAGLDWQPQESLVINGVALHGAQFSSDSRPAAVAQRLSVDASYFQRLIAAPGRVVLSGLNPPWHWLADIEAHGSGARGHVSALHVGSPSSAGRSRAPDSPQPDVPWLPAQAQPLFYVEGAADGAHGVQAAYLLAGDALSWRQRLRRRLTALGWQAQNHSPAGTLPLFWRRGGEGLMLAISPAGSQAHLFFSQTPLAGGQP